MAVSVVTLCLVVAFVLFVLRSRDFLKNGNPIYQTVKLYLKKGGKNRGLSIRAENRRYLTKKVNRISGLIAVMTGLNEGSKNEKTHQNVDGSSLVAGNLEKSNEFLEDYYKIVCVNDNL